MSKTKFSTKAILLFTLYIGFSILFGLLWYFLFKLPRSEFYPSLTTRIVFLTIIGFSLLYITISMLRYAYKKYPTVLIDSNSIKINNKKYLLKDIDKMYLTGKFKVVEDRFTRGDDNPRFYKEGMKLYFNDGKELILCDEWYKNLYELKIILDLYGKMVSEGSWKDYGLNISSKQVGFSVFKNSAESAMYKICKNFKPLNKNLKYLIIDSRETILKNSYNLKILLNNINWKKL